MTMAIASRPFGEATARRAKRALILRNMGRPRSMSWASSCPRVAGWAGGARSTVEKVLHAGSSAASMARRWAVVP